MTSQQPDPLPEMKRSSPAPSFVSPQDSLMPRTPPGPRGKPVIGSLRDFLRDPLVFLLQMSHDFPEDGLIRFYMVGQPLYLVNSPHIVRHILLQRPENYARRARSGFDKAYMIQNQSLAALDGGAPWLRSRRLMQPAFHQQRIDTFAGTIVKAVSEMLDSWSTPIEMNVTSAFTDLTLRMACETLLSVQVGTRDAQTITQSLQIAYAFLGKSFSPIPLWVPLPGTVRTRVAMRRLHRTMNRIIQEHHARPPYDLLSLLLDARDDRERPLTDTEICYELVSILIGGQNGTMLSLTWILALLAQHPDAQLRLQQEVDEVLDGRAPTLADLPRLSYMQKIIDEALRLYPQFWTTGRVAIADEPELVQGYQIKAGDVFLLSPYVMHRHPLLWPDAETFDPERNFNVERGVYLPFGLGQRLCIGMPLARLEMQIGVAMIVQRFSFMLTAEGFPEPEVQFALHMRRPLVLDIQAR